MKMTSVKKKHHPIRYAKSDIVFLSFVWAVLILLFIIFVYPMIWVISASFSAGKMTSSLSLIPAQWSLEGYRAVFTHQYVWSGYLNSILYTVVGTLIAMVVTILCAYPLSRRDFRNGKYMMALCMFTMYFSGGMIPTFLWIKAMGLLDTIWSLVLPGALSVHNMIVVRTYFSTQIPHELREAAEMDGVGDWRFLVQIAVPLSVPVLAVILLYYAVDLWNSYFNAMLYIRTRSKLPLPNILRELLILNLTPELERSMSPEAQAQLENRAELMKYSLIIVSTIPMMMLYPFVQKYFLKGVMIGSIKG